MVLSMPTLQLNKNWLPISVITVREAFEKLVGGTARVVDEEFAVHDLQSWSDLRPEAGKPYVSTAFLKLRVPEVIVLNEYDRVPAGKLNCSRANIYKRDNYTCQYCGKKPHREELTIEHVVPRSKGGKTSWTNCVLACLPCNARKSNMGLGESGMRLLSKPVKPNWSTKLVMSRVRNTPKAWEKFITDAYWNVELES